MALTYLHIKISNPVKNKKWIEKKFLVDSGAIFSVVPADLLKSLYVKSIGKQRFVLANGEENAIRQGSSVG